MYLSLTYIYNNSLLKYIVYTFCVFSFHFNNIQVKNINSYISN